MMPTARDQILGAIRCSLKRGALPDNRKSALRTAMAFPPIGILPARGCVPPEACLALFRRMAEKAGALTSQIDSEKDIPMAVAACLAGHVLPLSLVAAPALEPLAWKDAAQLSVTFGVPSPADRVGVALAAYGVAESGTVVMESGSATPNTLNFLPDIHIVILHRDNLVGVFEEVWNRRRTSSRPMPRTLTMITGPSRTGDIDLTLVRGAHGPRVLHILIVGSPRP